MILILTYKNTGSKWINHLLPKVLLLTVILVIIAGSYIVVCASNTEEWRKKSHDRLQHTELPSWTWAQEQWTAEEAPFLDIQANIDRKIKLVSVSKMNDLVRIYEDAAISRPDDAKAQFAWGYAAISARKAGYDFSDRQWGVPLQISFNMDEAPSLHSYQYDRVRFLIAMWWQIFPQLKNLGFRLLKREPNDYDVKYYLVHILSIGDASDRKLSVTYAEDLAHSQPKRPSVYIASGAAYYFTYRDDLDNKVIANKAIAAYRKYISLIPADDQKMRNWAKNMIALIQDQKAQGKNFWKESNKSDIEK